MKLGPSPIVCVMYVIIAYLLLCTAFPELGIWNVFL
jgi:hypothetical protein